MGIISQGEGYNGAALPGQDRGPAMEGQELRYGP